MIEGGHEINLAPNPCQIVRVLNARFLDCFDRHLFILAFIQGEFHLAVGALAQGLFKFESTV